MTEYGRLVAQETLITDALEELIKILSEQDLTLQDLALRTGKSQVFVNKFFSGEQKDIGLRDLADFATALGYRFRVELREEDIDEEESG